MSYIILEASEISNIRERLNSGKLEGNDTKFLDYLASRAQRMAEVQSSLGRLTVDQLPVGMDLVK